MCGAQMRLKPFETTLLNRVVRGGKDVWGSDEIETALVVGIAKELAVEKMCGAQMRLKPCETLQWHLFVRMVRGAKLESSAIERK